MVTCIEHVQSTSLKTLNGRNCSWSQRLLEYQPPQVYENTICRAGVAELIPWQGGKEWAWHTEASPTSGDLP